MTMEKQKTGVWGILSLILGILGILLFLMPYIGIIFSIIAIILYGIQKKHKNSGFATGGLITGIIGVILNSIIILLLCLSLFNPAGFLNNSIIADDMISKYSKTVNKSGKEEKSAVSYVDNKSLHHMNEEVPIGNMTYKVTKVENLTEMNSPITKRKTKGKLIKVYLQITNKGKETKQIFAPTFEVVDHRGRTYDRLNDDFLYINNSLKFREQLQPGLNVSGAIIFELLKDTKDLHLKISADWLSEKNLLLVELDNIKDIRRNVSQKDQRDFSSDNLIIDNQSKADELIFIESEVCNEACTNMEPVARKIANISNLEFKKITTPDLIHVPGYMIVSEDKIMSLARPILDKTAFYNEMCQATNNNQICRIADDPALEAQKTQQKKHEQECIPKKDKPTVDLYIMSFCPYGNKAENTLEPVYEKLKDKADFNVNYIVSEKGGEIQSLHGSKEVKQNKREVCVMEEYSMDEFFDFITYVNDNCGSKGDCWEKAANEAGVDTGTIQTCVDERGTELLKKEAQKAKEAGASGSPTMLINGQKTELVYNYGQPAAYQKAICAGFSDKLSECGENMEDVESAQGAAGSC